MTDWELDFMMRRVLLDAAKLNWEEEAEPAPPFQASARHQRQVTAMLADPMRWARKRARPVWEKAFQRVAVVLLVFSLSLGSLMAVSPTVRAAVVRWVTEWYEAHITYRYSGETNAGEMPRYEITDLPEGYVEDKSQKIEWSNYVRVTYYNEETDKTMFFDYVYMQQGSTWDYVTEDVESLPVTVNGLEGQLFLVKDWEDKWNTITWIDPKSNLQFSVDANLSQSDILHIAESVSLVKIEN